ncbi:MAG: hypothetical protein EOP11_16330 [Proteobacteria bacterium]|nr:MAG: hypothetical protein EOP11_16330 [Pseudomonadota bacterium]
MPKKIVPFALSLLLAAFSGCGKHEMPSAPSSPAKLKSSEAIKIFKRFESATDEHLNEAASTLLVEGTALSSKDAERCLGLETASSHVKDTCALLWATGPREKNAQLESYILRESESSSVAAIALALHNGLHRNLSAANLIAALRSLRLHPLWIKAKLITSWLNAGGIPDPSSRQALLSALKTEEPLSPESLGQALVALEKLDGAAFQEEAGKYCRKDYEGSLKIRCWRALTALSQISESAAALAKMKDLSPVLSEQSSRFTSGFSRLLKNAFTL